MTAETVTQETKPAKPTVCTKDGCEKKPYSKGLCRSHYEEARVSAPDRERCNVEGCDGPVYVKHQCRSHYTAAYRKTHRTGLSAEERDQLIEVIDRLAKQQPKSQLVAQARKILRVEQA
jgi:hypothetical protein